MARVLGWLGLLAAITGCETPNAYAPFGPPTIPAPAANQLPYYPPGGVSATSPPAATSTRPSISVSGPSSATPRAAITAEAADRQPIRIVEKEPPTRTADSGRATTKPPQPVAQPQSAPSPPVAAPKHSTNQRTRLDTAVEPASRESDAQSAFREAPAAAGPWRAR